MEVLSHYFQADGPGAALGLAVAGEPPVLACRGLADLDRATPIDAETRFDLASASKVFTAVAVLALVESGRLSLESPVHELLGDLQAPAKGRPVRVRDLLCHTSGLADYLAEGVYADPETLTHASVRERLPGWSVAARPGQAHDYSNTNYVVLGQLIESTSGQSFADFLNSELLAPHGLEGIGVGHPCARGYANLGTGEPWFQPFDSLPLDTLGDGGLQASLVDLLEFWARLIDGQILQPSSLETMFAPGRLDDGAPFSYGLGVQVEQTARGCRWVGHGGSWTDATVLMGRYLDEGVTLVVLSNEIVAPVERIAQRVMGQWRETAESRDHDPERG